jgi:hypothetical protein
MIDSDETNVPGDLSIADVQKRLSISRAQVYNLVNTGRLMPSVGNEAARITKRDHVHI